MSTSDPKRMGPIASADSPEPSKAERRAARAAVGRYHEAELQRLVDRVRNGLARYDAGEVDVFELDDLIHHYTRATQRPAPRSADRLSGRSSTR